MKLIIDLKELSVDDYGCDGCIFEFYKKDCPICCNTGKIWIADNYEKLEEELSE